MVTHDQMRGEARSAITHLYELQGKSGNDETIDLFLNEFDKDGIPMESIVKGCEHLKNSELGFIKYATIKNAAKKFYKGKEETKGCSYCTRGIVVVVNTVTGEQKMRSCPCVAGKEKQTLVKWSGEDVFFIDGVEHRHYDLYILGDYMYEQVKNKKIVISESNKTPIKAIVQGMADDFDATNI